MSIIRAIALIAMCSVSARGQGLDLGGFDLRLGASFDSTLRSLSAVYELQYLSGGVSAATLGKIWWVRRKDPERTIIGDLEEKDGKLVGITREWAGGSDQIASGFVALWREAQRLGGSTCVTTPEFITATGSTEITHITSYTTKCGRYLIQHGVIWPPYVTRESLKLSVR